MDVQKGESKHKVEARPEFGSDVADDEVNRTGVASDSGVERTRPDLRIRR